MIKTNTKGFTIIELMMATVVFSLVLVLCLGALVQIGRMYYKGVTTARTQESARSVIDTISQAIQFSGGAVTSVADGGSPAYEYACIGDLRFSYIIDRQRVNGPSNEADKKSRHVVWVDNLSNCASRSPNGPLDLSLENPDTTSGNLGNSGRELLGENMRLSQFSVVKVGDPELWQVRIGVVYGDQDLIEYIDGTTKCKPSTRGTEYCAASELTATVQRRIR